MKILKIKNISKHFGGIRALDRVNLDVNEGEILSIMGPNGSGKTTLFNCITGVYKPTAGEVLFEGKNIVGVKPHKISLMGISRTFQIISLFPQMTVLENTMIGMQQHQGEEIIRSILNTKLVKNMEEECIEKALKMLNFVGLSVLKFEKANELSYGQQKLLQLAIAMMPDPKIVLLDEPTSGVNPIMIKNIIEYIKALNKDGKTFVVIEHNVDVIMRISERIICLDSGNVIAEGSPQEIKNNKDVIDSYLGV